MIVVTKLLIREYSDLVFGEKLRVQILNKFRAQFPLRTSTPVRPKNYSASPLSTLQSTSPKLNSSKLLSTTVYWPSAESYLSAVTVLSLTYHGCLLEKELLSLKMTANTPGECTRQKATKRHSSLEL